MNSNTTEGNKEVYDQNKINKLNKSSKLQSCKKTFIKFINKFKRTNDKSQIIEDHPLYKIVLKNEELLEKEFEEKNIKKQNQVYNWYDEPVSPFTQRCLMHFEREKAKQRDFDRQEARKIKRQWINQMDVRADFDNESMYLQSGEINIQPDLRSQIKKYLKTDIRDYEWSIKLVEDLTVLCYTCNESINNGNVNKTKLTFAIVNFIKLRTNTSMINSIFESKLLSYGQELFKELLETKSHDEIILQSAEENINMLRSFLDKYSTIKDSVFYKKVYKLCLYAMSLSLFDKLGLTFDNLGYTTFEAEVLRRKYHLGIDFVHTIIDSMIFFCERGFQILKTGNMEYLFHNGNSYVDYMNEANTLKRQATLLSNPEAHGFTESSFRANLDDMIEKGDNILSHSTKLSDTDKRFLRSIVSDLKFINCDLCTKRAAREHRKAPFSVLIFGESGIGKSTIKDIIFNQYAKVKNLDNDPSFLYTRNAAANFWDGFCTSQWGLILDDIGAIHPNKAPNGDDSMMELIQIVNSVPFVPDQADLSNKGRTPMKCKLVIGTTNVKNLNAHYYFSHPSAVQRRFPFIIIPVVRDEFANTDGTLNSSKTVNIDGQYPDYWLWTIQKVLTRKTTDPQKIAEIETIHENVGIIEMLKWYNQAIIDFDENQNKVEESVNAMKSIQVCQTCYLPIGNCDCEIQSTDIFTGIISDVCEFFWSLILRTALYFVKMYGYNMISHCTWHIYMRSYLWAHLSYTRRKQYLKLRMKSIGDTIQNNIGYPIFLASFVGILLIMSRIVKYYRKLNTQSGISSKIGVIPTATENERENVWVNNNFVLSTFDLTRQTLSSKGMDRDTFIGNIRNNCVHFNFHTRVGKVIPSKAVCLKGQKYLTNNHNIPILTEAKDLTVITSNRSDGVTENLTFKISESMIIRDLKNDILIITLPNLPPKKDITKYFANEDIDIKTDGFYLSRQYDGEILQNNIKVIQKNNDIKVPLEDFSSSMWTGKAVSSTVLGDCGSILIGETVKGYVIMGIHMLGNENTLNVASININSKMLSDIVTEDIYTIQSGTPELSSISAKREIGELHHKSVFRYISDGTACVYGSFKGFRPTHKSCVELSPMAHFLSKHDYTIKHGAPIMKGYEPWRIAALDMVNPVTKFDPSIVEHVQNCFIQDIINSGVDLTELKVYDNFTAINGAPGVAYVDKINRNTSAGNPWKTGKRQFMNSIAPIHGCNDPVDVDDEIMDRVDDIISKYHRGERAMPNFCAHLKDEPVSFKKIKAKKTRVFTGAPFDWTIVVRKYLLSAVRLIQRNKLIFESAPGTVAQSSEWTHLYDYITKFGKDRIIAGDYKAFDKRMSALLIKAAFKILHTMCEKSGNYTGKDLMVIKGIAQDTAFSLVDFNGDLVLFYGTNPSGHPLTVIINGFVNCLYMRYSYYILNPNKTAEDFKSNVALMTYGDDNIMSVNKNIDWFTHTNVAKVFADLDITYTMADKDAISVPLIHISQASFLKRTWVYNEEVGYYFAPLEHDSIEKMLMIWCKSKTISEKEQCIAVITSAVHEYFFYGKITFDEKVQLLKDLVKDLELEDWLHAGVFPTWNFLIGKFLESSEYFNKRV